MIFDVAIVGGGPAGAACAATCASAGLRTLVLERATFPREKVCGDCLNPACWPILERLGVESQLRVLPHRRLDAVEFIDLEGSPLRVSLPQSARGEIAIKRSLFDQMLLQRARELGAEVIENCAVTSIDRGWTLHSQRGRFEARTLVAADGRNSTVARLLNLLPAAARDRVGLQAHVAAPPEFGAKVALHFHRLGYCGVAPVDASTINVCLVSQPQKIDALKSWAAEQFAIATDQPWRTITPLARAAVPVVHDSLLLAGDVARVVEPFTGEGIYYALASGELAARHIIAGHLEGYARAHRELYRGRLWINQLTRLAVTQPRVASAVLGAARIAPGLLRFLTSRIVAAPARAA